CNDGRIAAAHRFLVGAYGGLSIADTVAVMVHCPICHCHRVLAARRMVAGANARSGNLRRCRPHRTAGRILAMFSMVGRARHSRLFRLPRYLLSDGGQAGGGVPMRLFFALWPSLEKAEEIA